MNSPRLLLADIFMTNKGTAAASTQAPMIVLQCLRI